MYEMLRYDINRIKTNQERLELFLKEQNGRQREIMQELADLKEATKLLASAMANLALQKYEQECKEEEEK